MTTKCFPSKNTFPSRESYDQLKLRKPIDKFRSSPIRKNLVISPPRTLGTAIGRHIALKDRTSEDKQSKSIFLDEAIKRQFTKVKDGHRERERGYVSTHSKG